MPSRILEVCVDSFESAVAAITGGANRLELCCALSEGGLTPTPGLLLQVAAYAKNVPIFCMLRCRPGDFLYTPEEVEIMKRDAAILQKHGANGFVFGALSHKGEVDMKTCREIILASFPLPVTFHRAFDLVRRPTIEIEVLIDLGFKKVLTSGQQPNAQLGVKLIKKLMDQVGTRIVVIAGCGINRQNLQFIIEHTDALEYHGSFRKLKPNPSNNANDEKDEKTEECSNKQPELIVQGADNKSLYVTDKDCVAEIVHILKTF